MRLASFKVNGQSRIGLVEGDGVLDLTAALDSPPVDMPALLAEGEPGRARVREASADQAARASLSDVELLAPVQPRTFFAVGLNYADHVAESGLDIPDFPTVFLKAASCVTGPYDDVERPLASKQLDYEGELGIVIGQRCRHVAVEDAHEVIAGYVVVNDLSVRDWQTFTPQWSLGKSFDTHGPLGPWIVTGDEIDPHSLDIRTWVNDELRQESNTRHLIFDCFDIVKTLSTVCTLQAGDVIATGTSSGVALARDDQPWLVPGDRVRVEIEGIGAIENLVIDERADAGHTATTSASAS